MCVCVAHARDETHSHWDINDFRCHKNRSCIRAKCHPSFIGGWRLRLFAFSPTLQATTWTGIETAGVFFKTLHG